VVLGRCEVVFDSVSAEVLDVPESVDDDEDAKEVDVDVGAGDVGFRPLEFFADAMERAKSNISRDASVVRYSLLESGVADMFQIIWRDSADSIGFGCNEAVKAVVAGSCMKRDRASACTLRIPGMCILVRMMSCSRTTEMRSLIHDWPKSWDVRCLLSQATADVLSMCRVTILPWRKSRLARMAQMAATNSRPLMSVVSLKSLMISWCANCDTRRRLSSLVSLRPVQLVAAWSMANSIFFKTAYIGRMLGQTS
jgi:hypothetical protein